MASGVEESLLFCYSSNCFAERVTLYIVVFFFPFFVTQLSLGNLVTQPGIKPMPPAVEAWIL